MDIRAGFVALTGRPNVGKSTLLNTLLGQKIAIASPRPQTTRNRVLGVRNLPGAQIVYVDTPGLHRPTGRGRTRLNRFMIGEALQAIEEVDAVVLLVDGPMRPGDRFVIDAVDQVKKPVVLAVNKVDAVRDKRKLLPMMDQWSRARPWAAMVPISARTGDGLPRLEAELTKLLPVGTAPYPEEMVTDRPERWIAAELVREQAFLLLRQEVPYALAVSIDAWQERPDRADVVVSATVHVEKEAQKKIVVGEGGRMVRDIGTRARKEIEKLLGRRVHLQLFVRVDEGWTDNRGQLRDLGYQSE